MNKATPEQLCNAITEMDGMAQKAFSEIASMASLALLAMEQPSTYANNGGGLDAIAHMLHAIKSQADDITNCINSTAEVVGCNSVDEAERRRWDARRNTRLTAIHGRV
jgi:hypothetical protein